jgi:hypothetical protein
VSGCHEHQKKRGPYLKKARMHLKKARMHLGSDIWSRCNFQDHFGMEAELCLVFTVCMAMVF